MPLLCTALPTIFESFVPLFFVLNDEDGAIAGALLINYDALFLLDSICTRESDDALFALDDIQ